MIGAQRFGPLGCVIMQQCRMSAPMLARLHPLPAHPVGGAPAVLLPRHKVVRLECLFVLGEGGGWWGGGSDPPWRA